MALKLAIITVEPDLLTYITVFPLFDDSVPADLLRGRHRVTDISDPITVEVTLIGVGLERAIIVGV